MNYNYNTNPSAYVLGRGIDHSLIILIIVDIKQTRQDYVQTINLYNVVDGCNTLPAWHKSIIWDAATTAGVYSTRAKPGFRAH